MISNLFPSMIVHEDELKAWDDARVWGIGWSRSDNGVGFLRVTRYGPPDDCFFHGDRISDSDFWKAVDNEMRTALEWHRRTGKNY